MSQKRKNKWQYGIFIFSALAIFATVLIHFTLDKKKSTFVVSGHPEWPLAMYQDNDKIAGVGTDIMKKIGKDLGFNIKSEYSGQWDQVQRKAENGEIDALVGMYETVDRDKYFDFSLPYMLDPVAVYVKKGKAFDIPDWDNFIGKKGVLTTGDSYGQALDMEMAQIFTTVRVNTVSEAFDMLVNDQADYFIYAYNAGDKALKDAGLADQVEILPKFVVVEDLHFAISKSSPMAKYLPEINKKIEQYKLDGTVDQLTADYRRKFYND